MNPLKNTIAAIAALPSATLSTKQIYDIGRNHGMKFKDIHAYFMRDEFKVGRGQFDLTNTFNGREVSKAAVSPVVRPDAGTQDSAPQSVERMPAQAVHMKQKVLADTEEVYVPEKDETYVAWGDFGAIKKIIASRTFHPVYVCGESGNGKTLMIEQACAQLKREYVRIQITPETDEADLIGSFRLVNGETVFHKGPIVRAMERGALCLIDELDRGSNKIMCLQSVLEGKPVLIKKIGEVIRPANGFNIIATANTKGHGSDDGKYSAATIIDEAFLERFVNTIEQPFPTDSTEKKILLNHCEKYNVLDHPFVEKLVAWSNVIRKTYKDGGVDEVISTRRLCHIIKTHSIFNNRKESIAKCIARFDEDVRSAFTDLYDKIDSETDIPADTQVSSPT